MMKDDIEAVGMTRKHNGLAWKFIGGGMLCFAAIIAFLIYNGVSWDFSLVVVGILGLIGAVPLCSGVKHLLAPAVLIATDNKNVYIIYTRRAVEKIAMTDIYSIFPSAQLPSDKHLDGIEIKTNDGLEYVRSGIMYRYWVIQVLANKIYEATGNKVDYYTLERIDGNYDDA